VLCVVFGRAGAAADDAGPALSPVEVHALFARSAVTIAAPIVLVIMAACGAALIAVRARRHARRASAAELRVSAGLALLLAGLFSGATGTCSRGFVSLLASLALGGARAEAVLTSPAIYLFALALLASLAGQIFSLNAALKQRPAGEVVPIYQSSILLVGSVFGWVFWREGAGKTNAQLGGFVAGIVILLSGFALLFFKADPPLAETAVALTVPLRNIVAAFFDEHAGADGATLRRCASEPGPRPARVDAGLVLLVDDRTLAEQQLPLRQPPLAEQQLPPPPPPPPLSPQTERPKSRRQRASLDAAVFAAGRDAPAAWRWASAAQGAPSSRRVALSPKILAAAVRATEFAPGPPRADTAPPHAGARLRISA
jgi:hypothetical protein